jgi:hypothetical protein
VLCIASFPLSCFVCGTHKRHQRPRLQPKEHEKKRHIRSDLRVVVRATAIILVGVGGTSGSSSACPHPVFEERVNQTRLRGALNHRTPSLRNDHSCCEGFFCISSTSCVAKRSVYPLINVLAPRIGSIAARKMSYRVERNRQSLGYSHCGDVRLR